MAWYTFLKIVSQVLISSVVLAAVATLGKATWDQIKKR